MKKILNILASSNIFLSLTYIIAIAGLFEALSLRLWLLAGICAAAVTAITVKIL